MKILSVTVPCYNSEAYMRHAIDSILPAGEDVEILIVDDGSTDGTAGIADEYEKKYPGIVQAIHKENGGHGDAVMCGLSHATGLYFRVLDSDDWFDSDVLQKMIRQLKTFQEPVDLFITDFIYDKTGVTRKHVMQYANALPEDRVFTWEEMHNLHTGQYILMHSATYRREMLLECGLSLPKHTFYVDNLYVYVPMRFVRRMYYMHETLYHYYIGREDQSVHENVMIQRIDQQMLVNRLMLEAVDVMAVPEEHCRKYLYSYFEIITAISSILAILSEKPENLEKRDALWETIREKNPELYQKLAHGLIGSLCRARSRTGMGISRLVYHLADKVVGFN